MSDVTSFDRCPAAHPDDPTGCEGGHDAVRIVDQHGTEALGCIHHAARLYASLERARVYPTPGNDGAALDVYRRAQTIEPFEWLKRGRS